MKKILLPVFALILLVGCNSKNKSNSSREETLLEITVSYEKQDGTGSNQYAVWIEDGNGRLIKTLYVTKFTAEGGYSYRPNCTPEWVNKAHPAQMSESEIDAISGSTPLSGDQTYIWDFTDQNGNKIENGTYVYAVQGTYWGENQVIYKQTFDVNSEQVLANPQPVYSSGETKNRDMIQGVKAQLITKTN